MLISLIVLLVILAGSFVGGMEFLKKYKGITDKKKTIISGCIFATTAYLIILIISTFASFFAEQERTLINTQNITYIESKECYCYIETKGKSFNGYNIVLDGEAISINNTEVVESKENSLLTYDKQFRNSFLKMMFFIPMYNNIETELHVESVKAFIGN